MIFVPDLPPASGVTWGITIISLLSFQGCNKSSEIIHIYMKNLDKL